MFVWIDVDGVLADIMTPALSWHAEKGGQVLLPRDVHEWNAVIGTTDVTQVITDWADCAQSVLDVPAYEGAAEGVRWIQSRLHTIGIATSRPPALDEVTRQWLDQQGIPYHRYVNTSRTGKGVLGDGVLIDDGPHNLRAYCGWRILCCQPWNEKEWARFHMVLPNWNQPWHTLGRWL